MNFKPNEFFLGLVEFIVILLPGAALTVIICESTGQILSPLNRADGTVAWVTFVFVSFGLGYFLNSIASGLDVIYDEIRKAIYPYEESIKLRLRKEAYNQIIYGNYTLAEQKALLTALAEKKYSEAEVNEKWKNIKDDTWRKALLFFFELESNLKLDRTFTKAKELFQKEAPDIQDASNTYQWSMTILNTWYPGTAEQINRTMAASKFFRSLVIVSALLIVLQWKGHISEWPVWASYLLLVFSFREYIVQRNKSTSLAYRSILILFSTPETLKK